MRAVAATIAAFGLLLSAGLASAEEATGVVVAVDPEKRAIMLDNGETYTLADGVEIEGLEPGSEVLVSFEDQDNGKVAIEIAPAQ